MVCVPFSELKASAAFCNCQIPSSVLLLLLHPFNSLLSRTTCVSRHQKGKPFWILLDQEMWQCHQLDHVQIICISLRTDNHASTSPVSFADRMPFCSTHSVKALNPSSVVSIILCVKVGRDSCQRRRILSQRDG